MWTLPLPLSTPLLLVKPPVGLSTPAVFKALDLGARSTADPQQLLSGGPWAAPQACQAGQGSLLRCLLVDGFGGSPRCARAHCIRYSAAAGGARPRDCMDCSISGMHMSLHPTNDLDNWQSGIVFICHTFAPAAISTIFGSEAGFVQG